MERYLLNAVSFAYLGARRLQAVHLFWVLLGVWGHVVANFSKPGE